MSENLRKDLGIDEWLELVKEDKNLNGAYISFGQYMHLLEQENQQLKEDNALIKSANKLISDKLGIYKSVIEEAINFINNNYIAEFPNEDILLEILDKAKGSDSNE